MPRTDGPTGTEPQWKEFAATTAARHGAPAGDYPALWQWSVDHPAQFWRAVWEHFDVRATNAPSPAKQACWPTRACPAPTGSPA